RCRNEMQRKVWQRCASAAAWVSPCASSGSRWSCRGGESMFGIAMAFVLAVSAGVFEADGTTPSGTFSCSTLAADKYDGADGELMPSNLGDVTLDGRGGYTQGIGSGQ